MLTKGGGWYIEDDITYIWYKYMFDIHICMWIEEEVQKNIYDLKSQKSCQCSAAKVVLLIQVNNPKRGWYEEDITVC